MKEIILNSENVKLNVKAKDWEEAIRIGAGILVYNGFAKQCYVEGIIASIKKYGSYVVISKGFAIPHTRPEEGAIKIGFSLITLKEPVYFDGDDDPVKVMICFSAINNESHLNILQMIVEFVDKGLIDKIAEMNNLTELLNLLEEVS